MASANGDVGGNVGISFGRVTTAADVVSLIEEEAVIAHSFARAQGGIPQIATDLFCIEVIVGTFGTIYILSAW